MSKQSRVLLVIFVLLSFVVFAVQRGYLGLVDRKVLLSKVRNISFADLSDQNRVRLFLAGDVMLGRTVMTNSLDKINDPAYPFWEVAGRMREADIVFVNLENPVVEGCPRHYDGLKFCADPRMVDGLVHAGVDVVTLANNHSRNYGEKGIEDTKNYLDKVGIKYVGLGNLEVIEIGETKFGFLGFELVDRTSGLTIVEEKLLSDSNRMVGVLVVGVHWGNEYKDTANRFQREIAKEMVQLGADLVVGHHPHWVQPFDYAQGEDGEMKPIYYSLGNFVFDQMWSTKTRQGLAVELVFDKGKLKEEEKLLIFMEDWAQPKFVGN